MFKKLMGITLSALLIVGCTAQAPATTEDPTPAPQEVTVPTEVKVSQGLGKSVMFRNGPGKDSKDVPVYSFNYVYADATFDEEGRIINVFVDALEVSTPNYDGATMPHFSGWPGTEGYNVTDHATEEVSGVSENTEETIAEEVNNWQTKRERGADYGMNPKLEWNKQMDNYQEFFKGKTVAEIEEWFAKYGSDVNGRPVNPDSPRDEDKAKVDALSAEEKAMLADVRSGATMSLNDGHGNIIAAIKDAYENRVEVVIPVK
jgi:hypothetical protein